MYAKRGKALSRELPRLAAAAAQDGLSQAQRGLSANVYATAPGLRYQRTGQLLRQLYAAGTAGSGSLTVELGDRAAYASHIEYGTGPYELSPAQLEAYLKVLPPGGLLQFGRSGRAYLLPGPYIGPGLRFAQFKTHERVQAFMQKLWT
ncbi:hypothetical protein ASF71_14700 [Deinococcus sp. Leaf326]|nr:hypothetical protein ASF71_14700 [Deinococcus sp. Leaf326]